MKYAVSVRALCEFTAKQGDLDLRFTPAPSAQEGVAGHGIVTSRRPPHYQAEVSLSGEFGICSFEAGDGFDPVRTSSKKSKTFRGTRRPCPTITGSCMGTDQIYGMASLSEKRDFQALAWRLVYFAFTSKKETC